MVHRISRVKRRDRLVCCVLRKRVGESAAMLQLQTGCLVLVTNMPCDYVCDQHNRRGTRTQTNHEFVAGANKLCEHALQLRSFKLMFAIYKRVATATASVLSVASRAKQMRTRSWCSCLRVHACRCTRSHNQSSSSISTSDVCALGGACVWRRRFLHARPLHTQFHI